VIDPRLRDDAVRTEQRAAWRARGSLRVEGFLERSLAPEVLDHVRRLPYQPAIASPGEPSFLFWRCAWKPEESCDHLLCALGRCIRGEVVGWASDVTGLALAPPDGLVVATLHEKGSFADLHEPGGRGRAVAFVLGLSPEPWPAESGGHLEIVDAASGAVLERRAPAWNALDLIDVRGPRAWRVPIVREHVEGRAIAGWLALAP
jgi:hypothetical protein